jgi:hypothetical protein
LELITLEFQVSVMICEEFHLSLTLGEGVRGLLIHDVKFLILHGEVLDLALVVKGERLDLSAEFLTFLLHSGLLFFKPLLLELLNVSLDQIDCELLLL